RPVLGGLAEHLRRNVEPARRTRERQLEHLLDSLGIERASHGGVHLGRALAHPEPGADNRADAAAGDVVDGVARLLEHVERADVRIALRSAGAECKAELRAREVTADPTD